MRTILADALLGLRARRGRTLLAGGGVFAASLVLGVVATAAYALATGFDRSADRADLPSVIARFADEDRDAVDEHVSRLPNLAARANRTEITRVGLHARGLRIHEGVVHIVGGGRRGYAIVEGRDVSARGDEAVIEARPRARVAARTGRSHRHRTPRSGAGGGRGDLARTTSRSRWCAQRACTSRGAAWCGASAGATPR